ncbi:MAG: TIGR04283 family arsenosugar biosynthesis glycosyltransferase [Pseudomonadota bacterium]
MSVSVVVPVLNEIEALPVNLERLLSDTMITEVIVVDGGSRDGTQAFLEQFSDEPRIQVISSRPGRGRQMNAGAQLASGDWLLFHHADSILCPGAVSRIAELPESVKWGGFKHQFGPTNWKLKMISALHNWRWSLTGVVYGDQSMFVHRDLFFALEGFTEADMEDLEFSDRALGLSQSCLLDLPVITSSRKFTQIGELKALAQVIVILWRYERSRRIGHERFFLPYR